MKRKDSASTKSLEETLSNRKRSTDGEIIHCLKRYAKWGLKGRKLQNFLRNIYERKCII